MPRSPAALSLNDARRLALAAQGFDRPRPRRVTGRDLARVIERLGLVQLDFVTALVPAHYQVLFSRLGPYRRALLHDTVYRRGAFTEQWAHEASIVPMDAWPLLRHRRETHRVRPWGFERFLAKSPAYVKRVVAAVRRGGALTAADLPPPAGVARRIRGDAWVGTVPRATLEALFGRGTLAVADRRPNFARVYDLAERVIPAEHRERRVDGDEARRELLRRAARALGVGTAADLADYFRMSPREARPRIMELVTAGELDQVQVEGWREPAYCAAGARAPRAIRAAALLSPFDPVVWHRPRAERLFGFDYRLEIYTPAPRRRWGYYVLPFLLGERIVARVDLKADRTAGRLLVPAAYRERHADPGPVAAALAAELRTLADWLGLGAIVVAPRGDLARPLVAAL
jgi:uncharacterized protein YcaQ